MSRKQLRILCLYQHPEAADVYIKEFLMFLRTRFPDESESARWTRSKTGIYVDSDHLHIDGVKLIDLSTAKTRLHGFHPDILAFEEIMTCIPGWNETMDHLIPSMLPSPTSIQYF